MPFTIVDIFIVLIIIACVVSSYKLGFIRFVIERFAFIGGLLISFFLTSPLSEIFADMCQVDARVNLYVVGYINESKLFATSEQGATVKGLEQLNALLDDMSVLGKFAKSALADVDIVSLVTGGYYKDDLVNTLVDAVNTPIMLVINICVFFIVLILSMFILNMCSGVVGSVLEALPLIGGVNHFLGGLFGILSGAAWSVIFVVIFALICVFASETSFFNLDMVTNSLIGKMIWSVISSVTL
jgi:uncharacterized membrane protein required for colicin V production